MAEYDRSRDLKSALFKSDVTNLRRSAHSAVSEAQVITSSLVRMRSVIAADLQRMQTASSALVVDGELIGDTLDEHRSRLATALKRTGRQLRAMARAEFWEKYSVLISLWFFLLVCAWVIVRRTRLLWLLMMLLSGAMNTTEFMAGLFSAMASSNESAAVMGAMECDKDMMNAQKMFVQQDEL